MLWPGGSSYTVPPSIDAPSDGPKRDIAALYPSGSVSSVSSSSELRLTFFTRPTLSNHQLVRDGAAAVGQRERAVTLNDQPAAARLTDDLRRELRVPAQVPVQVLDLALLGRFRTALVLEQVDRERALRKLPALTR